MRSRDDSEKLLLEGMEKYVQEAGEEAFIDRLFDTIEKWKLEERLYQPDSILIERLSQFEKWCAEQIDEDPGRLMEEIALLAFRCLKGFESVKSYQSYAAQIDLLISGSTPAWMLIMKILHIDIGRRSIVVEAKNLNKKVDDKQFSRFCYHIQNTFTNTTQLGVFFTRFGATGFREREKAKNGIRQRSLRDAQATQILFHARYNKYVVVFEKEEILSLCKPGSLIKILEEKIRTIEEWTGLSSESTSVLPEIDLPEHLSKYFHREMSFIDAD
jgi:hypothetical protein